MRKITAPLTTKVRLGLKCAEEVLLSGTVYTVRDAAHKELVYLIDGKKKLPFDPEGAVIYYAGPTPLRPDGSFGSCGPTTSSRMDKFTAPLLKIGLGAMIGKGRRNAEVCGSIKKHGAIYFLAVGGAGAFLAKRIKASSLIAFEELGPEAIYKLEVRDFPVMVGIDSKGNDIFGNGE